MRYCYFSRGFNSRLREIIYERLIFTGLLLDIRVIFGYIDRGEGLERRNSNWEYFQCPVASSLIFEHMLQKLSVPVSVNLYFDHRRRQAVPALVVWENRKYPIVKIGLHHTYRQGRTLYHVFSAAGQNIFFRLVFNTENLSWLLEEIADGEAE